VFVTGLVLAAGASQRLGQPKQLLPYRGTTLLGTTLAVARSCRFDQLIVTLGGASPEVHDSVDLHGFDVVENLHFSDGCSSSIVAALDVVDRSSEGIVLLLGDQPGVDPAIVQGLVGMAAHPAAPPLALCRYRNGRGHPFWFHRDVFDDLSGLHGDKGVWRLLEAHPDRVAEHPVDRDVPLDVDSWDDYLALLDADEVHS
jgi:molybdenum cofactor cytidylyltransferase